LAKKKINSTQILSIVILLIFVGSTIAGILVPIMKKDDSTTSQEDITKQLEELQKQQAEQQSEETKEVDPNLKIEGDVTSMQIIDITTGTGQEAKLGDTIKVKYKGALASSGEVFDSNDQGVEFQLKEGNLITGWIEGVPGMKIGGKRKLIIPSEKGYGAEGAGSTIPANADLVFEIELVSIGS
jgi:FKBP-type peptidyl-prolyl cis-trans isomerase